MEVGRSISICMYVDIVVVFEVVILACALRVEFVKEVIEFTLGVAVAPSFLLIRCKLPLMYYYGL